MLRIEAGNSVDRSRLNGLMAFDAVCDPTYANDSGSTFGSIQDAIDSGAKSIFARTGFYNEDIVINQAGVTLIGESFGYYATGAYCQSFQVTANRVTVKNFSSDSNNSSGISLQADASYAHIENCAASRGSGYGFRIEEGGVGNRLINCASIANGSTGFSVRNLVGTESITDLLFSNCKAYHNDGAGFDLCNTGSTTGRLTMSLDHCHAVGNAAAWSSYGFLFGPKVDAVATGCQAHGNGVNGHTADGFFVTPGGSSIVVLNGCISKGQSTGFRMGVASTRTILNGCGACANVTDFMNCASARGYNLTGPYGTNTVC